MRFFQTLAEGGQTWAHRVRMVRQVLKIALSFSLLTSALFAFYLFMQVNPLLFQSGYYHAKGLATSLIKDEVQVSGKYWEKITSEKVLYHTKKVPIPRLLNFTQPHLRSLQSYTKAILWKSLRVLSISIVCMLAFFFARGTSTKRKQHVSGKKRIHPTLLRLQLILKRKASKIKIGKLPLVKGTETQHILVTGGTGSGKTNCFHQILPQIRREKQQAIIIDTNGTFINRYYDASRDIILNPFDERGSPWHPWVECVDQFDYDSLAESFIPQTSLDSENYWRTAARSLVSSVLQKTKDLKRTSELTQWLLFEPLDRLAEFVQETRAAAHIDVNSEKTAASIRSVASSFLGFLEYLRDTESPFSIRKWIQESEQGSWLFLGCKPSQRSTLNPLLSCWFSIAVRSLLQMEPNHERRVWFVIDELPTLHKLKELESFVTESRKYGGCGLFALQTPAQLEEIYGRSVTQTIIGNCATRIIFAELDPEVSQRISKSLGENEIKEYQEGISYGAHEVRDGVSLSLQTKHHPTISATEIQSLQQNEAFVRLQGNLPITQIKLDI